MRPRLTQEIQQKSDISGDSGMVWKHGPQEMGRSCWKSGNLYPFHLKTSPASQLWKADLERAAREAMLDGQAAVHGDET